MWLAWFANARALMMRRVRAMTPGVRSRFNQSWKGRASVRMPDFSQSRFPAPPSAPPPPTPRNRNRNRNRNPMNRRLDREKLERIADGASFRCWSPRSRPTPISGRPTKSRIRIAITSRSKIARSRERSELRPYRAGANLSAWRDVGGGLGCANGSNPTPFKRWSSRRDQLALAATLAASPGNSFPNRGGVGGDGADVSLP